jgi:hypothetical protein
VGYTLSAEVKRRRVAAVALTGGSKPAL